MRAEFAAVADPGDPTPATGWRRTSATCCSSAPTSRSTQGGHRRRAASRANLKFERRFRARWKRWPPPDGGLAGQSLEAQDRYWDLAKAAEKAGTAMSEGFTSFRAFYPYYLGEHRDRTCRRLHFVGTSFASASSCWRSSVPSHAGC